MTWNNFNSQASHDYRAMNRGKIIPYPVEFLNRTLKGVRPTDLVFFGARPGAGKTQLATMMAQNVSEQGLTAHYFALEADKGEIETRLLYTEFAKLYYSQSIYPDPINFRDFSDGDYDGIHRDFIKKASIECNKKMQYVNIMYRKENFTVDDFEDQVNSIKHHTDCIILDHIHHFDMDTDRETQELKKIVKRMRDINILIQKPIVCIAHFRKSDRKTIELCPGFEELYGSSEIAKEATQVITMSPVSNEKLGTTLSYDYSPTLFRIPKFRKFGVVGNFVGMCLFNTKENVYQKKFEIYKLIKSGQELEKVDVPYFMQPKEAKEIEDL